MSMNERSLKIYGNKLLTYKDLLHNMAQSLVSENVPKDKVEEGDDACGTRSWLTGQMLNKIQKKV